MSSKALNRCPRICAGIFVSAAAAFAFCGLLAKYFPPLSYSSNSFHVTHTDIAKHSEIRGNKDYSTDRTINVSWPKIILFGDSFTQRSFSTEGQWGAILADHFQRKCDVVARGFSGYNTRMCKAALPAIFGSLGKPIAAVVVFLGANDANSKETNPQQHVPVTEYRENLWWIANFFEVSQLRMKFQENPAGMKS